MIVVTGAAGFIGSALVQELNRNSVEDVVIVDNLYQSIKWQNIVKRQFDTIIGKEEFPLWLQEKSRRIKCMVHLGACSTTTQDDGDYLIKNNLHYSQALFEFCANKKIPFLYASSAATYGSGEHGFSDQHDITPKLRPINRYGFSKHIFDRWALKQKSTPPNWFGFKFFNVYGPNEYHKASQASVVYHAFPQVKNHGKLKLFKSYRDDIKDGMQQRDFIYVKDVCRIIMHFIWMHAQIPNGLYNIGTGKARSFLDLGNAVFDALGNKEKKFEFIDMPDNVKSQYQYFTEASISKLVDLAKYKEGFSSLEDGIRDYIQNYLNSEDLYL